MRSAFVARQETCAQHGRLCSKRKSGYDSATVSDSTRRCNRPCCDGINDARHQRKSRNFASDVSASFDSLCDDNIHASSDGALCIADGTDLLQDFYSGAMSAL